MKHFIVALIAGIVFSASIGYAATTLFVNGGGTGRSTLTAGQLLSGSGTGPIVSVPTTSVSCSGGASCTSFTAIGSSPVTITATGGSGGSIATSTDLTNTYLVYATAANTVGDIQTTTDAVRWISSQTLLVGTSSASSAKLEVRNQDGTSTRGLLRIISNSSSGADYDIRIDSPDGDIEFCDQTTRPAGCFEINSVVANNQLYFTPRAGSDAGFLYPALTIHRDSSTGWGSVGIGTQYDTPGGTLELAGSTTVSNILAVTNVRGGTDGNVLMIKQATGFVGLGSTSPSQRLTVAGDIIAANITATGTATTTYLGVTSLNAASCDVKATTGGAFYCGTDATGGSGSDSNWIWTPGNSFVSLATTTNGIIVRASSTIGGGTGATGLTVLGNATATSLYAAGSSLVGNVRISNGDLYFLNSLNFLNLTGNLMFGANGDKMADFQSVGASGVNYPYLKNAITGTGVTLGTDGTDASVNLVIAPKGSGFVGIGSTTPSRLLTVAGDIFTASNITAASGTITFASTTGLTATNATLTNATTTTLGLSGATGGVLVTSSGGSVSASTTIGDSYISDTLTLSGGTIGSNNISGTLTTTGTLTLGDGGDTINIDTAGWDLINSNLTGLTNVTVTGSSTLGYASSTALTVSGNSYLGSLTGMLKGTSGLVSTALDGTDFTLINATTCSGTDKVSAIAADGTITCSTDQTSAGSGGSNWTPISGGLQTSTSTDFARAAYFVATNTSATSTFPNLKISTSTSLAWLSAKLLIDSYASDIGDNQGMLGIHSNDASGGNYDIRIDSPNVDLELIETDQTAPAGKFEIGVQNDKMNFNLRNSADSSFVPGVVFSPVTGRSGLAVGIGTDYNNPGAMLAVVATSSKDVLNLTSSASHLAGQEVGDLVTVLNNGRMAIGSSTPTQGKLTVTQTGNTNILNLAQSNSATTDYINFESSAASASNNPCISWNNTPGAINHGRICSTNGASYTNSNLTLSVADSSKVLRERFRIDVNGTASTTALRTASSTIDNATTTNLAATGSFTLITDVISNVATWFSTKLNAVSSMVAAAASTWDFGGATSVEIPNGAAPVVDTAGEIALDTTDDQVLMADAGGVTRVIAVDEMRMISATVPSSSPMFASGKTLAVLGHKDGLEFTQFRCYVIGGTSKVVNLTDGTNDTETITCGTTMTSDSDVATNDTFTADELGYMEMGATTGTVDYLHFEAWARITRE